MDSVLSAVGASRAGVFARPGDFRPALVDWSPTSMELNIPDPGTKGGKATYRAPSSTDPRVLPLRRHVSKCQGETKLERG